MHVARWGTSLVLQMSEAEVAALGVKEGDEVAFDAGSGRLVAVPPAEADRKHREEAIAQLRAHARPLPEGYRFDREEANAR